MRLVLLFVTLLVGLFAMAQVAPSPSPTPAPVAASSWLSDLVAHRVALGALVYWFLDVLVWLVPGLQGNGLLHQLQLWVQGISGQQPPAGS